MKEWKECKLGDTGKVITGKTPSKNNPEDWGSDIFFITPSDYKNYGKKAYSSIRKLSEIGTERQKNRLLPPFSVLVTCIGSDMGKSVVNVAPCVTNQQINAVIPNKFVINEDYLYYLTVDLYETLRSLGGDGTAVPILNKTDFENIDILLPPLPEQRAIAGVLSSLDDKIDLLHRQNKTLEGMAEALWRKMFVEESDPEWKKGRLGDEMDITMGQSPPGHTYNEDNQGMLFFQGRAEFGFRFPEARLYCTEPKRFAKQYDTLVSVRAPVGDINMASEECCIGRGLAAVRHKQRFVSYTFYKIRSLKDDFDSFEQQGTVFGSIGKDDFNGIDTIIPDEKKIQQFDAIAKPLDDKIFMNSIQIRTLSRLRDTLLPKLMSGEVKVKI